MKTYLYKILVVLTVLVLNLFCRQEVYGQCEPCPACLTCEADRPDSEYNCGSGCTEYANTSFTGTRCITTYSGDINGDHLNNSGSILIICKPGTYTLNSSVNINTGASIYINPGVTLELGGNSSKVVNKIYNRGTFDTQGYSIIIEGAGKLINAQTGTVKGSFDKINGAFVNHGATTLSSMGVTEGNVCLGNNSTMKVTGDIGNFDNGQFAIHGTLDVGGSTGTINGNGNFCVGSSGVVDITNDLAGSGGINTGKLTNHGTIKVGGTSSKFDGDMCFEAGSAFDMGYLPDVIDKPIKGSGGCIHFGTWKERTHDKPDLFACNDNKAKVCSDGEKDTNGNDISGGKWGTTNFETKCSSCASPPPDPPCDEGMCDDCTTVTSTSVPGWGSQIEINAGGKFCVKEPISNLYRIVLNGGAQLIFCAPGNYGTTSINGGVLPAYVQIAAGKVIIPETGTNLNHLTGDPKVETYVPCPACVKPPQPTTQPITLCAGDTPPDIITAGITSYNSAENNLVWYENGTTSTPMSPSPPVISTTNMGTTPVITTYYVSQQKKSDATCESDKTPIVITVNAKLLVPTTRDITICTDDAVSLLDSIGYVLTNTLVWYDNNMDPITQPTIDNMTASGPTVYHVSQKAGSCESPTESITVTINQTPVAPTTQNITICTGDAVSLLDSIGYVLTNTLVWYDNNMDPISAPTINNGVASGPTTYHVSQKAGSCESFTTAIVVTISSTPTAPTIKNITICTGDAVSLLDSIGYVLTNTLVWYDNNMDPITQPTIDNMTASGPTVYHVSQKAGGCESPTESITVTISQTPVVPTTQNITICTGDAVSLLDSIGYVLTNTLVWYDNNMDPITQPTIDNMTASGPTVYHVSQKAGGCESPTESITVTISQMPVAPTTQNITICTGDAVSLLDSIGYVLTNTLVWYDNNMDPISQPTIDNTTASGPTIYHVSQKAGSCESPTESITVTVSQTPVAPTTQNITICTGDAVSLLDSIGYVLTNTLVWYDDNMDPIPTPTIDSSTASGSTTYNVSQKAGSCESPTTAIVVTISAAPTAPTTQNITICTGDAVSLLDSIGYVLTNTLVWYDDNMDPITQPTIDNSTASGPTIYHVSQKAGSCESPTESITVTINQTPVAPTTKNITICMGDAVSLLDSIGYVLTNTLVWYDNNMDPISAPTINNGVPSGPTTYHVSQKAGSCESPTTAIVVTISSTPSVPTTKNITICTGDAVSLLDSIGYVLTNTPVWYDNNMDPISAPTINNSIPSGPTTYHVSQKAGSCESPTTPIVVTISPTPSAPTTKNITICMGDAVSLLDSIDYVLTNTLVWYDNNMDPISAPTINNGVPSGPTTYHVSQKAGSCESPTTAIVVTISSTPSAPTTKNITICTGDAVSLLDSIGYVLTNTLVWYDNNMDPISVPTINNGVASGPTTYHVSQQAGSCESPTTPIVVTISSTPMAPTTRNLTICMGDAVSLLDSIGYVLTNTLVWYDDNMDPISIPTINNGVASGPTAYHVSQKVGSCESEKTPITVTINALPVIDPISGENQVCEGKTLQLSNTTIGGTWKVINGSGSATISQNGVLEGGSVGIVTVWYIVKTTSGCIDSVSYNVTVNPLPTAIISGSTSACSSGSNTTLSVALTGTQPWTIVYNNGSSDITISGITVSPHEFTVSPTVTTIYSLVSIADLNCANTASGSATVTIKDPVINLLVNPINYGCVLNVPTFDTDTLFSVIDISSANPKANVVDKGIVGDGCNDSRTFTAGYKASCGVEADSVSITYTWTLASKPVITTTDVSSDLGMNPTLPPIPPTFTGVDNCEGDITLSIDVTSSGPINSGCNYTQTWNANYTSGCGRAADPVSITYTWSIGESDRLEITLLNPTLTFCGENLEIELSALVTPAESIIEWFDSNNTLVGTGETITVNPPSIEGSNHRSEHNYKVVASLCSREEALMTVYIDKPLTGGIPDVDPICEEKSVRLDASSYGATSYLWTSSPSDMEESGAIQTVNPTETTWYYVDMKRGACEKSDSILVKVSRKPIIDRIDSIGNHAREIILNPHYGTYPFYYGVDDNPADEHSDKYNLRQGWHTFYVVDAVGCRSEMRHELKNLALIIPLYFTPNGDGVNDTWEIINLKEYYPDAIVKIYDRFGKKLVEYTGIDMGWDGTYLGNKMPSSDYWYTVYSSKLQRELTGHFTLLR